MALCPTGLNIKKVNVQIKKLLRHVSGCMSLGFTFEMSFIDMNTYINGVCERARVWCMSMCICARGVVVCVWGGM
jgi:hypothetical protein